MRTPFLLVLAIASLLAAATASSQSLGEGGIGITSPPDSVSASVPGRGCPGWDSSTNDSYTLFDVEGHNAWIGIDIDYLISPEFDGQQHGFVTATEAQNFLDALDWDFENRWGWSNTDLALTFKYAHRSGIPYDETHPTSHFLVFQDCLNGTTVPEYEINHVDIYLTPGNSAGYMSTVSDKKEDGPLGDPTIWHDNSMRVADLGGNDLGSTDEELWPRRSAQQACHEFTHMCWASNVETYGEQYSEAYPLPNLRPPDYNELFACATEYVVDPPADSLQWDVRYGYSVLNDMMYGHGGPEEFDPYCSDPPEIMSVSDRNLQRYHLWRLFGAYLGWRYPGSQHREPLLSEWSQNLTLRSGDWAMERTFCGLTSILEDDFYSDLGHGTLWEGPGQARASKLFADFGVARWVDDDSISPAYYFGSDYSPCWSAGQFRKIDDGATAYWELAIPPEFVLDGDNVDEWTQYPNPGDTNCPDGWYDYENGHDPGTSYGHLCVPVKVDLWGSAYFVFRADTDYFTQSWDDTLVLEFDWTGNMNQDVMLWMSVLTYPTSTDSLFLHGADLLTESTEVYRQWDPQATTITVPDFKRDHTEAVVVVLTVSDRLYELGHDSEYECMRRMAYTEGGPDVVFSYRFKVVGTYDPGGGCPVVASRTAEGYAEDNNVLASGVNSGLDILDAYLLSQRPEDVGGEYAIRITETDTDRTLFDRVQLLAVDHAPGSSVAVLPDGSAGTYSVSGLPVACYDSGGQDLLSRVAAEDGRSALIEGGSWIEVVFPASACSRGGGVGTRGNPGHKIDPPGGGGRAAATPGVLDLTELCYRANPMTRILDAEDAISIEGDLAVLRLTAPCDYYLDHIFLADWRSDHVLVQDCGAAQAQHSTLGDCTAALAASDESGIELRPGDAMELSFATPQLAGDTERDFVLVTEGRYVAERGDSEPQDSQPEGSKVSIAAYPNPFRDLTTISLDIPHDGADVVVRLYSAGGKQVRELASGPMRAGRQTVTWDGTDDQGQSVAAGVYFCKMWVSGSEAESRVVVLK